MIGKKYYINPETLRYERVSLSKKQLIRYVGMLAFGLISLAILMRFGFERIFPTPKQIIYQQQNIKLRSEYAALNLELQEVESQLEILLRVFEAGSVNADGNIVGRTDVGRATVSLLKFNRKEQVEARQALMDLGLYPPTGLLDSDDA